MDVVISLWNKNLICLDVKTLDLDEQEQKSVLRYSMGQAAKIAKENPY
jgi:hypothetical protein